MTDNRNPVGRPRRHVDEQGRLLCCLCDVWKDSEEFHANTRNSSGRDSRCKKCDYGRRKTARKKKRRTERLAQAKRAVAAQLM